MHRKALRRAIDMLDASESVAIIASGGCHTSSSMRNRSIHARRYGTKERGGICRWPNPNSIGNVGNQDLIVLAGAMEKTALQMRLINYVPCYRSPPAPESALDLPNGFNLSGRN